MGAVIRIASRGRGRAVVAAVVAVVAAVAVVARSARRERRRHHRRATGSPLAPLITPSGGFTTKIAPGLAAGFRVGAASVSFSPPLRGHAPGGDAADCDHTGTYNGPRQFAYEEPYIDAKHSGHFDEGDPYKDCNGNGRWDGNLIGGGSDTPRFYDRVADNVGARATVVKVGKRAIAVEVLDQEGLFNVYQDQIRARVRADGVRLGGVFISANHDESAPDSLGLGGVSQTTSGVNAYWTKYMVAQSAQGDRAGVPVDAPGPDPLHRGAGARESAPVLVLLPVSSTTSGFQCSRPSTSTTGRS